MAGNGLRTTTSYKIIYHKESLNFLPPFIVLDNVSTLYNESTLYKTTCLLGKFTTLLHSTVVLFYKTQPYLIFLKFALEPQ
jgi:hypothetical protein